MKKKILCSILALICMLNIVAFADGSQPDIPCLSLEGTKTEQNTIELAVNISGNSWICGCSFNLVYDNSKVKYVQHSVEELISGTANFVNDKYEENAIRVNWAGINELEQGGTALKFIFDILENAEGNAEFKIEQLKMADARGDRVESANVDTVLIITEQTTDSSGNEEGSVESGSEIGGNNSSSSGSGHVSTGNSSTDKKTDSSNEVDENEDNTENEELAEEKDYEVFLLSFDDVNDDEWFYESVKFVNFLGLMSGVSDNEFAPQANLTRGMLVTILYRLSDEPECGDSNFEDVDNNSWYSKGIAWAAENKIVNGIGDGKFAPNSNITREQIAVIMYNFSKFHGIDTTTIADVESYTDKSEISEWADDAMQWAVGSGLISGKGNNILDPKGNATRAEIATILMRYIEKNN